MNSRGAYIPAIVSSAVISADMSDSVSAVMNGMSIPRTQRINEMSIAGMMIPVRGRAIRFVRRKYWGNVRKYMYARGAVVI